MISGGESLLETLADYCLRTGAEALLEQWDVTRNLPLTPADLSHGSKQKVWWRCQKGHSWQAAVYTRTGSGTGCPVCAGKIPLAGETDLATLYPQLAHEWHPAKNGGLTPDQVLPGSHRKVWWLCEKGHEWQAQIKSRVAGCGCPVCAGREIHPHENDLASQYPLLAAQWHPTKNGALRPETLAPRSFLKVWWRCEKGHEWQASVDSRVSGSGCPVCSGRKVVPGENDLATQFPQLAAQWHPTKNGALSPQQVTSCSNRKVWWECPLGHAYQAAVSSRTMSGSGCPYCAGRKVLAGFNDLATKFPELAAQWHPILNGNLGPDMVTSGSRRKVWWECPLGHVWKAVVYSRTSSKKCGCPICSGRVSRKRLERYQAMLAQSKADARMR